MSNSDKDTDSEEPPESDGSDESPDDDGDEEGDGVEATLETEAAEPEADPQQRNGGEGTDPETVDPEPVFAPPGASTETFDAPSGIQLLEGEEVLHDLRPSWGNYSKSLWAALLTIWIAGLGVVFLIYPFFDRRNERYVITTERVIHRSGLLSTTTNEYRIADVRGIQTGQSFTENLFGSGTLKFTAAGGTITFSGIPDAQQVANTIRRRKAELE